MLFFLALAACDSEPLACDTMAAYSVNVTVDAPNAENLTVTYAVDGVDKGACDSWQAGSYACGVEMAGHFVITLMADNYATTTAEVDVAQGECHVEPEALTLAPEAVDCSDTSPSIVVNLTASDGTALFDPSVLWIESGGEIDQPCNYFGDIEGGTQWTCGDGTPGDFIVTGMATGYGPATQSVPVPNSDFGCGPETQTVGMVLEPDA